VKLYLDEDISPKVSVILRKKGVDAVCAHEADMLQSSDEKQLTFAVSAGRAMATRNRDDFIYLTVQFFEALKPHEKLIIVPHTISGSEFSRLADILAEVAIEYHRGMEPYTIEFVKSKQ
jgi:predicted nuclease of predicted toxin-antitoxin system